ncbi:hypothetical protein [Lutibacter sp. B1]|uniref:hypothetical protein n=1 Tax=Lutibacter sp. B1 TaxID=2725996 RepID=UPI0014564F1A|nr:hypothetical protein [Lutibacter sp. B1]NLP59426.1 hypothetical protein [Lutibacter sp. B1]
MDKTLKTLHLRLDSTSKSLTKNAISQLIIKILYSNQSALSLSEIEAKIEKILKTKIAIERTEKSLSKLEEQKEIEFSNKKYKLTRKNRKTLDKRYTESKDRLERITQKYFYPFHSTKENVIEWFSDSTIEFFKSYSADWISDLCYSKSNKIKTKSKDIFKHIERRTKNNNNIEKEDVNSLIEKFIDCLTNQKDTDIDAYLWEYGTSAFSANLLQSSIGADPISISAFSDSKCILDTNILIDIGLEASEYFEAFKKLDKIFSKLNIKPGYLHITKDEYINTVDQINKEIVRNVSKFDYSVIKESDDKFIKSAVARGCHLNEDFNTFCSQIGEPPKRIDDIIEIVEFNDDENLNNAIQLAQKDERKKNELNTIYFNTTNKDKREAPLIHDVGLIAGTEYYRKNEKAFIISQEVSINKYSHSKPHINNLPLAIKLETLINMLAIDNGGTDVNPNDFSNLFADMIRLNLQPEKNTFELSDLSKILDTELQIDQLPPEEIIKIANSLHQNISQGLSDEEVGLQLNRQFQEVKLKFVDDLDMAKIELAQEKKEKEKNKKKLTKTEIALRKRIKEEELKKYEKEISKNKLIFYILIPISVTIFTLVGIYFYNNNTEQSNFQNFYIGLIGNIAFWLLTSFIFTKPKLRKANEIGKNQIENEIDKRLEEETK